MTTNGVGTAVLAGLVVGVGFIIVLGILPFYQALPPSAIGPLGKNQEIVARIALANDTVQELFHGRYIETGVAQTGGIYSNSIIVLYQKEDRAKHLTVIVDTLYERVVSIRPSIGWISSDPYSLRVVDGMYRAEFSFTKPLSKIEYNGIIANYDIRIEYFEYLATNNITGGVSTETFIDLNQLEQELAMRHDAKLIGIDRITVTGKSEELLKFIEAKRDNISKINFTQVLG